MVICKYYQQGRCAYGSTCKFEHPGQTTAAGVGFGGFGGGFGPQTQKLINESFTVSAETIQTDLSKERPIWKISSYGPGKDPPAQLIDGKDISPEEMRVRAYECNAQGMPLQYQNEAAQLETAVDAQISNILRDTTGAVAFLQEANKTRANYRYTQPPGATGTSEVFSLSNATQPQPTSAFGQPPQSTNTFAAPSLFAAKPTSAFGQPSTIGSTTSAFGQPSLGTSTTPAFGQPAFGQSAFGQPAFSQPAFGQSAFGGTSSAPSTSAFGQSTTSAFGKPPAFGQPAFGQTAFGSTTSTPAFGQPAFGQPAYGSTSAAGTAGQTTSAFGASTGTPAFGSTTTPAFGQPAFGQTAFGQPTTNAFGSTSQPTTNAFGSPTQPVTNVFGQPSTTPSTGAFGQPVNAFASAGQTQSASAFGQPAPNLFSQPSTQGAFGQPINALSQQPPATQPPPQPAFGSSPFQTQTQNPSVATAPMKGLSAFGNAFGANKQAAAPTQNAPTASTGDGGNLGKWDDPPINYTQEELAAFRAPEFVLGRVPLVPPPQQMCR